MPMISIVNQLRIDYPNITFKKAQIFHWSPIDSTVYYADTFDYAQLLHETGHALLNHRAFDRDITLLAMERDAWQKASEIAPCYGVILEENTIETALDSYRDWLHSRSTCPKCSTTGVQSTKNSYTCPACLTIWRVNDARIGQLKRTIQK